ncbi:MAG TPA: HD domain-containing phosphohydrolase [Thermoanaerobaculia bacterium]|nr:HD domain-containing phosphohydrolase [Thermoanaerobaculia bacterium]
MLDEVRKLENAFKQILYGCVEHVHATKAALYLSASHDLNEKKYEIVTSYQYNPANRKTVTANDDLVDRLAVKRSAFFINSLSADQRFADLLFRQGNERLLAAPIFSRGRLIGFIDMRDKAGKKPFESLDVTAANTIAEQVLQVLAANKLFGVGGLPVSEDPLPRPPALSAPNIILPSAKSQSPQPGAALQPGQFLTAESLKTVQAARQIMGKRQLAPTGTKRMFGDSDLEIVRLLLPAALAIPGAVLACFSAIGHIGNPRIIVSIATVTDDALETLQAHLHEWLERNNMTHGTTMRPQLIYPFGGQVVPVSSEAIVTMLSAPISPHTIEGLVLTVAFERVPDAEAERSLQIFLRQIEQSVEAAVATTSGRNERQAMAEILLEPDFQKYPELADHCRHVASVAQRFAQVLELPPAQVETVRLAALVHDVGLRLLDYDRLYKRLNLTPEELRALAEHPLVGAALVEPLLGADVAQAVLRHHERVDGKGYPSHLTGNQIPIASRIVQIADAWVAMTARQSYQSPISPEVAAKRLQEGAGSQFDPALVTRFLRHREEIVN